MFLFWFIDRDKDTDKTRIRSEVGPAVSFFMMRSTLLVFSIWAFVFAESCLAFLRTVPPVGPFTYAYPVSQKKGIVFGGYDPWNQVHILGETNFNFWVCVYRNMPAFRIYLERYRTKGLGSRATGPCTSGRGTTATRTRASS